VYFGSGFKEACNYLQAILLLRTSFIKIIFVYLRQMKTIEVTVQEIRMATRPNVYKNKKKYTRKDKYRNKVNED
jgi:hypothetical protein